MEIVGFGWRHLLDKVEMWNNWYLDMFKLEI